MAAPASYAASGRNRIPEGEQKMYQLRAEQYLRMLTGIDAEEALNRGLDFEYNNAVYAVMDPSIWTTRALGRPARPWRIGRSAIASPPTAQARQCMTLPARGWWIPACSIGGVTDVWADGNPLSQEL